jgi:chromosome segregation ATPase
VHLANESPSSKSSVWEGRSQAKTRKTKFISLINKYKWFREVAFARLRKNFRNEEQSQQEIHFLNEMTHTQHQREQRELQSVTVSTKMTGGITKKEMIQMNSTASAIKGVLDNLRIQLKMLDDEIKADENSKAEFERHLNILTQKRDDIQGRISSNEEFARNYDADIGPFANK